MDLHYSFSLGQKDPLRVNVKEEIRKGVMGRPTSMTLHFLFLNLPLLSYSIFFFSLIFFSHLSHSNFTFDLF
jgi:hypothetical protein